MMMRNVNNMVWSGYNTIYLKYMLHYYDEVLFSRSKGRSIGLVIEFIYTVLKNNICLHLIAYTFDIVCLQNGIAGFDQVV